MKTGTIGSRLGRGRSASPVVLRSVLLLSLATGLAACDSSSVKQATPGGSATTADGTGQPSPAGSAGQPVLSESALSDMVRKTLIGPTALDARGYHLFRAQGIPEDGVIKMPSGPTMEVCNRPLDIDRLSQARVAVSRRWHNDNANVANNLHGYARAAASDAVSQVRDAVRSCTTYSLSMPSGTHYNTLAAPVTLPSYSGIDASFAFCEQTKQGTDSRYNTYAQCWALLAHGNLLSVLNVYWNGRDTQAAFDELVRLTPTAVEALRVV